MTFFIILLTISQIVSFYLIFNKVKPIIKPKTEGIILKVIPDKPTYESLKTLRRSEKLNNILEL